MRVSGLECLLAFALSWHLFAQSSSTITGQLTDQTHGVVANARIMVTAIETEAEYRTTTNSDGYYTVASLPPLNYRVSAEFPGFKKAVSPVFTLDSSSTARIDLVLVPADSRQVIEVTAAPPSMDTQNGMLGETVGEREIQALPLASRDVLELVFTMAGVTGEMGPAEGDLSDMMPAPGAYLSIGGGRLGSSAFLADGASANSVGVGRSTASFSPDSIQEFKVITSSFSAQYGATAGGIVTAVTKSGADEYHGNLSWFNRNPFFAARQFNSPLDPRLRRNELGLTVGGPLRLPKIYDGRRKTFFFASFEPKRWTDGYDIYDRVPTAEERTGDFRNSWVAPGQTRPLLYQQVKCSPSEADCKQLLPANRATSTTTYPLFSANDPDPTKRGHVIPQPYLDPLLQQLLKDVPLPNMPYDSSGNNYIGTRGVDGRDRRWSIKIDHTVSSRNRLTARYNHVPVTPNGYRMEAGKYEMASLPSYRSITRQATLSDSHTVSPRIVNEFRGSYTFSDYSYVAPGDLATTNYTLDKFHLPSITTWGYPFFHTGYLDLGLSGSGLGTYIEHQYQGSDDVTMVLGKHTLTAGTDWRFMQLNVKSSGLFDACCGTYNFASTQTNSGNNSTSGGPGGSQFASFLLGVPNSASLRSVVIPYYYRWKMAAAFLQDEYKVRRNLTLNVGLRWQYSSPRAEKYNRQASLDLDHPVPLTNAKGQVTEYTFNYVYSGFSGSRYLEPVHKRDFEPRFGFAWQPGWRWTRKKNLVLRGGYGISHSSLTGRGRDPIPDFGAGSAGSWNYTQWVGNSATPPVTQAVDPGYLVSLGRNQPVMRADPSVMQIPADGKLCAGCTPRDSRVPSGDLIVFSNHNSVPYVQTWNFTAQLEVSKTWVFSLSYMGQKGTHLYSPRININKPDDVQYQNLLDQGGDPTRSVADPLGRVDSAGNLRMVQVQDLMRPYPSVGNILVSGLTDSLSIYNAGTAGLEKRFRGSLGFRFNYTWSKSIDTNSDGTLSGLPMGLGYAQNSPDLQGNRSVSIYDSRHRFNVTFNSELPFGRRHALFKNSGRFTQALVSGWSANAIGRLYSGYPFAPVLGDPNGVPSGNTGWDRVRPDMVPGVPLLNPRWNKNVANDVPYFNPQAFARPAFGKLGNAARTLDYARNPWRPGLDISAFRDFRPFENRRRYFQVRADAFNALNVVTFLGALGDTSSRLFNGTPPVSRTGLSLAGPIPYLPGKVGSNYPVGTRENVLAAYYNQTFGELQRIYQVGPARVMQFTVKLYF